MSKYLHFFLLLFVLAGSPLIAGPLSSNLVFTARMSGDQENPQVASDGQGVAVLTFDRTQTNVYINVSVSNLSSPITGAHIHEGAFGENGPVVLDLTPFLSGNRIKGAMRGLPNTVMSKLLNEFLFDVPDKIPQNTTIEVDAAMVKEKLSDLIKNRDLSEFIL